MRRRKLLILYATIVPALTLVAEACPIPVYQYALEHWESDAYEITVRHNEALDEDEREALAVLQEASSANGGISNIKVSTEPADNDNPGGPAMLEVRYPRVATIRQPLWAGALNRENVASLLNSPVRERLGEAMASRTSAVWLLLESGDRRLDRDKENILRRELSRLEDSIVVPDSADWGGEAVEIDADVNFEVMRVSTDDPAEKMLVRMLLGSEPDLSGEFAGQPMVFPIYGRGLILYALVGRGINAWTIQDAVEFITGPCSCQIKAANPGTDILLSLDWGERVEPWTPPSAGATVGSGTFLQSLDKAEEQ